MSEETKKVRHPIQPLELAGAVIRFKENKIVTYLLDNGPNDMNKLARLDFSREDREQFAQLIGYSHSGASDLGYFSEETLALAEAVYQSRGEDSEEDITIEVREEKPLPCAYCRVVPNVNEEDDFWHEPVVERWAEKGCFVCHQFVGYPIKSWNNYQKQLLELRRKDFEAGQRVSVNPFNGLWVTTFDDYIARKDDE